MTYGPQVELEKGQPTKELKETKMEISMTRETAMAAKKKGETGPGLKGAVVHVRT